MPRLPRVYVPRIRVSRRLDQARDCAVTQVVAPAGAGKTFSVAGWIGAAFTAGEPAARWLHADETWGPDRLREVLDHAAAERVVEGAGEGAGGRSGASGSARPPGRVVIDDAHLLPAASCRALAERLNEDPESMRLVLLSRWDLPIAHLVPELLGHFAMIRGDVLRLDEQEARALIVEHARTADPTVVEAITSYAQGWCAAVVLASRAVAVSPDPVAAARRCTTGDSRFGDRIASDVFASLSPRTRHLLLCLSAEQVVTPATAAHLANDAMAGEILADLDGTGLLVSRIVTDDAEEPVRYRLHPLLNEVVRRRLITDGVDVMGARATVVRAVLLDAAGGATDRALPRLETVRAFEEGAAFLADYGAAMVMRGEGAALAAFARDHPDQVESCPDLWFPLAIERWVAGDTAATERLLDQCLAHGGCLREEELACARLMRARLGREPLLPAVGFARGVVLAEKASDVSAEILPQLLTELAMTQSWLGDLHEAEVNLVAAVGLARTRELPALRAAALSHLALAQYMLGRERACTEVAGEALSRLDAARSWSPQFTRWRLELALGLARTVDVPWDVPPALQDARVHPADLCSVFWLRVHNAHAALTAGSIADGRALLQQPLDLPESSALPDHLLVVWLVEEATLAALAGDRTSLKAVEVRLAAGGFRGEAGWVGALRADLEGDRRLAAELLETAADDATFAQPVIRPVALVARAQLLDELGEGREAHELLRRAVVETEVRRNAAPFLGWTRQGTPIQTLLDQLVQRGPRPWAKELADAMACATSIATYFDPGTATPAEAVEEQTVHLPLLSAREREVLRQLARGATYADISATLFVSENTVKTHVSNLYAKLGAARRSEALALARSHHLI